MIWPQRQMLLQRLGPFGNLKWGMCVFFLGKFPENSFKIWIAETLVKSMWILCKNWLTQRSKRFFWALQTWLTFRFAKTWQWVSEAKQSPNLCSCRILKWDSILHILRMTLKLMTWAWSFKTLWNLVFRPAQWSFTSTKATTKRGAWNPFMNLMFAANSWDDLHHWLHLILSNSLTLRRLHLAPGFNVG